MVAAASAGVIAAPGVVAAPGIYTARAAFAPAPVAAAYAAAPAPLAYAAAPGAVLVAPEGSGLEGQYIPDNLESLYDDGSYKPWVYGF